MQARWYQGPPTTLMVRETTHSKLVSWVHGMGPPLVQFMGGDGLRKPTARPADKGSRLPPLFTGFVFYMYSQSPVSTNIIGWLCPEIHILSAPA